MKKLSMIFAMAAIALTSCLKEEAPVVNENGAQDNSELSDVLVEKIFTVGDVDTKTYIDGTMSASYKMVIKWCADDEIAVWDGKAYRKFTIDGEPSGNSATFKGMVSADATEFYAIYPYSEDLQYNFNETQQWKEFTLSRPSVQYANPEGGLAEKSAVACGKADENGNIKFLNRSALLKFSLAEGMKVKSITFIGNDNDVVAGTLDIRHSASANFSLGWKSAGKSTELTFCNEDGSNLKTGVDYYISLIGKEFKKGYAITLTLEDGTTLTRNSNVSIQYMSSQIYSLSSRPLSKGTFDYYQGYIDGEDIMIAGKVYNKETNGNATLISAATDITAAGVYFIEPDVEGVKFTQSSSIKGLIIIGRNPSVRSKLTQSANIQMTNNYGVALMNLDITNNLPSGKYMFNAYVTSSASNKPTEYRIDNCRYLNYDRAYLYYRASDCYPAEIVIRNSDFQFTLTNNDIWLFNANSAEANIDLIDMQNNVFWHSGDMSTSKGFRITNGSSINLGKLVFKKNIFYNLPTRENQSSYVSTITAAAEITNNIFYSKTQPVNGALLQQTCENTVSSNNYSYTETEKTFGPFTQADSNPFTSFDITTGALVKATAYKNYGASR